MNELTKTLAFAGAALVLFGAAAAATLLPDLSGPRQDIRELGQEFFPKFLDPLAATSLEVIDYDEATATPLPFKVMLKDGKWSIPSHHDYPADAKDRLARTATGVMDLRKDKIASDRAEDHEALGVVDPLDEKTTTLKGRGKRVTLKDKSGATLADFIIGKEVPGTKDRPGRTVQHYVRVPGQKRTYGVNVDVDLSTKFADWIETNLLNVQSGRIRRILFDNHKVDPEAGTITPGERLTVDRKDGQADWTMEGLGPEEEVDRDVMSKLTNALADLKIVGVRPKPAGMTEDLKTREGIPLTAEALRSLASKGFYALKDGRLLSNNGDVRVATDEGVVYILRYGEVTFATGEALSAGAEEPRKAEDAETKEEDKADQSAESRYLFVTVEFDPTLIPDLDPPKDDATKLPADLFARDPDDPERVKREKAAKEKEERDEAERNRKIADAQKGVKELNDRFAAWYYVTPGDSFRSIVLDREALVKKKGEKSADALMSPAMPTPGDNPRLGLPPGHP